MKVLFVLISVVLSKSSSFRYGNTYVFPLWKYEIIIISKYYDSVYTERFMRTPQENFEGYAATSPLRRVKNLQGKLLLVHGTADDNVHFMQTMEYAEALVQANKQFDMHVYKDRNHSIYGGNTRYHLYTKMANYLFNNL